MEQLSSQKLAKIASRVLRDPQSATIEDVVMLAASVLVQAKIDIAANTPPGRPRKKRGPNKRKAGGQQLELPDSDLDESLLDE